MGFLVSNLPVAKETIKFAEQNTLDAQELALYGGEEYELVVTIDPKHWAETESAVADVGGKLLPIGRAKRNERVLLDADNKKSVIEARGYEHFKVS